MAPPLAHARRFDDILDGYFPLSVSVQQMMERNRLRGALILLSHAPVLHLRDRGPAAPVPMRLGTCPSGLIRHAQVVAQAGPGAARLWVAADHHWRDAANRPLTGDDRLAEPAFVRGWGW